MSGTLHNHRWRNALLFSIAAVGILSWGLVFQQWGPWWTHFTVHPQDPGNLLTGWGYVFFHSGLSHLLANAVALLILGTLSLGLYPRATLRTVPLAWMLSFLFAWCLGSPGSQHLGASGLAYGLMAMLTMLGIMRRDRPAIAAGLLVWFFFAGAWWSMLPGYPEVSWQGHLGGALGGVLGAWMFPRLDPNPFPEPQWEDEGGDGDQDEEPLPFLNEGQPWGSPVVSPASSPREIGYNGRAGASSDRE